MEFLKTIDDKQNEIIKLADTVWENPELAFKEFKSSAAITSSASQHSNSGIRRSVLTTDLSIQQ